MTETGVRVYLRTVQRVLHDFPFLKCSELGPRPIMTNPYVKHRLEQAKEISQPSHSAWRQTIFYEEKRFYLDEPDVTAKYWRDKGILPARFSRSENGRGGLTVWAGISHRGKNPLVFIENPMGFER